jgi:catechol 2,3-dioxygenase-like lactoylglutathione lyase family enzyme
MIRTLVADQGRRIAPLARPSAVFVTGAGSPIATTNDVRRCTMALELNHVHLKTHDPEKTAKFYVDTLGAKIVGQAGSNGYRLDLHGLALNVTTFLNQSREQKYGMEHIAIDTDELDTVVEKLKAQGINILEETTISGGRRVCFFEGPDGVQLEFIEMKK